MPKVVENMLDAKVELDGRLRTVINEFTKGFATRITAAVSAESMKKKGFDRKVATRAIREEMEKEVPFLRRKLDEYIDDLRTKETLVGAIQDLTIQNYEDFFDNHVRPSGEGVVSSKGKGREDAIWDPDAFADFSAGVFKVGRLGLVGEESESDSRSVSMSGST